MFLFTQRNSYPSRCTVMGKGSGYGKVILFGEHFVVHGVPGIVSAIDATTDAEVKKAQKGINVRDERKTAKGYSEEKRLQQIESIERMLKTMGIDPKISLRHLDRRNPPRLQRTWRFSSKQRRHRTEPSPKNSACKLVTKKLTK